jgi:hypothetical protein
MPIDPSDPIFPQQSYPVLPIATPPGPFELPFIGVPTGYNPVTGPKPSPNLGLQLILDFRPPRVTPQVPPARIPPGPVAAVTAPVLYTNVNLSYLPKLKVAGPAPVSTTVDIYQQLR